MGRIRFDYQRKNSRKVGCEALGLNECCVGGERKGGDRSGECAFLSVILYQ